MLRMTHQILQVSYLNPRNQLEIFWAQGGWDIGGSFRFTGCRTKTARLMTITIPAAMKSTVTECDQPDWWSPQDSNSAGKR